MQDRTNTIAGWALAGAVAALGLSIVSGGIFVETHPEKEGYPVEAVEGEGGGEDAIAPIATRLAEADVAAGEAIYKGKCTACHTDTQGGANGLGPNLWGVVGAAHGHRSDFAYSDAVASIEGPWSFDALDEWLESPRRYAPGTKMTFAGLSDPQDRANVIAYLNAQGSNLPFPPPPAPAEEETEAAEGEAVEGDAPAGEEAAAEEAEGAEATANEAAPAEAE
ncbi:c-type cytochrome [Stakelama tenebrarum]|uniref:Cytochrome c family protein n=1 Tax=Stakelama tenebrarum TaxID=2711215 RepID=A0A6G6Y0V9_9SPHN|nr:cytochrome c family protein [Sphingosinithalassobacter tenebrarum]QIG78447.1 cytochrome c family protein [Sphingosinithalassobacter tenebrarum]